jgi:hypothetical protein
LLGKSPCVGSVTEREKIESVAELLADEFRDRRSRADIRGAVARTYLGYKNARVRTFVPSLVQRRARELLQARSEKFRR